ncbi:MAG: immunoglobulin domain-containing protein [Verrucomicrobiae bacterium]|nr:immunoglobulin domain-containing protein [Verrucomicrobiae bacterium]
MQSVARCCFGVAKWLTLAAFLIVQSQAQTPPPLITEFMAINNNTLTDEDNDRPDWIEIYNPADVPVNLAGWSLTDQANNLRRWIFPATNLAPRSFLIVFASSKNRAVPGAPLHANFNLAGDGEYLALVNPSGQVVSQFAPRFPRQNADISYGVGQTVNLLSATAAAKVLVPNAEPPPNWMHPGFDDSSWQSGANGVGFQYVVPGFAVRNYKAAGSFQVGSLDAAFQVMTNPTLQAWVNTAITPVVNFLNTGGSANFTNDLTFPGLVINTDTEDFVTEATALITIPGPGPYTFGVNSDDGFILQIGPFQMSYPAPRGPADTLTTFNFPAAGKYPMRLVFYERGGGAEVELFAAPGSYAAFDANVFRLVGDTANGGLPAETPPLNSDTLESYYEHLRTDVSLQMLNQRSVAYVRLPFQVADPAAVESLSLRLRYDDGCIVYLNGIEVYRTNAPVVPAWNALATAAHSAAVVETVDLNEYRNALIPGQNVLAIQGFNLSAANTDFLIQAELVDFRVQNQSPGFMSPPTPGAANQAGAPIQAPPALYSVASGVYTNAVLQVELYSLIPGAQIRYSLNGAPVTANSPLYTNGQPLIISNSAIVSTKVFAPGYFPSRQVSAYYTLLENTVYSFNSPLPIVVLDTFNQTITPDMDPRATCIITVFDTSPTNRRATLVSRPDFQGRVGVEGRGQTSWSFPDTDGRHKKPYNLEIRGEDARDRKVAFLDFPEGSDFALINVYNDKTFLNDFLAYELFEKMGHYSVRRRFVEVYWNGTPPEGTADRSGKVGNNDYVGVYLLVEKIRADANRVNIEPPQSGAPGDPITGGFIFKKDKASPGDLLFYTTSGQDIRLHEPRPDQVTTVQVEWLRNHLNEMEAALYGPAWRDRAIGYRKYIDVDSFVDNHWIVEFTKQIDGYRLSNYMYKGRTGKIKMEPIWDWNLSFGNANYLDGGRTNNWYYPLISSTEHIWLRRLISEPGDPDFQQAIADRWAELAAGVFNLSNVLARVDELSAFLAEPIARDLARWPRLARYLWPNPNGSAGGWHVDYQNPSTHAAIIAQMKTWITGRFNWIDQQFIKPPTFSRRAGPANAPLVMTAPAGAIYYTLNGADPRLPGGSRSPQALLYTNSIIPPDNSRITARVWLSNQWSAPVTAVFGSSTPSLVISELMYNPAPSTDPNFNTQDYEFIELLNTGSTTQDLTGLLLSGGVDFRFPIGNLAPAGSPTLQDFDSPGTPYTTSRLSEGGGAVVTSGGPAGQFIRLTTPNTGANRNRLAFNRTLDSTYGRLVAEVDFRGVNSSPPLSGGTPTVANFDASGTPYTLSGTAATASDGGPYGTFMRLTPAVNSLNNGIFFNRTAAGTFTNITMTFDFRMTPGAGRADGLGVAFLNTANWGTSGNIAVFTEEPNLAGSLAFGFDIYNNGNPPDPNNNHISIHWNGALVSGGVATPNLNLASGQFHRAEITLRFSGGSVFITVRLTPNIYGTPGTPETLFNNFQISGVNPYEMRLGICGRTGGENAAHDIDNVNVEFGVVPPAPGGLSLVLLPTAIFGTSGAGSTLAHYTNEPVLASGLALDLVMGNVASQNSADLYYQGRLVTSALLSSNVLELDNGQFHRARWELIRNLDGARVHLSIIPNSLGTPGTPIAVLTNVQIDGLVPQDFRLELAGRNGGQILQLDADNVRVEYDRNTPMLLAPGERILVVKNRAAFESRYGTGFRIAGEYERNLANSNERLNLTGPLGEPIFSVRYEDWYRLTDGAGFSLVLAGNTMPDNNPAGWRVSTQYGGSPGAADLPPPLFVPVVVNEVLSRPLPPLVDAVELHNPNTVPADISFWWLTDNFNQPYKYQFPSNTIIPPGGFLVVTEADFNRPGDPRGFGFRGEGEEVYLFSANAAGQLTGYYHGFDFGASDQNVSLGRHVISNGNDHLVPQRSMTFGATNSGPVIGPVVISEVMYHPPDYPDGRDNKEMEFIELLNITDGPVWLFNPAYPSFTWRLRDAVDYEFPSGVILPPQGRLLVVSFDPATEYVLLEQFRNLYRVPPDVPIYGPYSGKLDNSQDSVELTRPGPLDATTGLPDYLLVDKVRYSDNPPWPQAADSAGFSLHRLNPAAYGNDPANWTAGPPTAGRPFTPGVPPVITQSPVDLTVWMHDTVTLQVAATGEGPLQYHWRFNGNPLPGATNAALILANVQLAQAGVYQAVVLGPGGAAESAPARLTVWQAVTFTNQPRSLVALAGTNITLSAGATGNGPVTYQWQRNGVNLPGATSATLTLTNVQVDQSGLYRVVATDALGSVPSAHASVLIATTPAVSLLPTGQVVRVGGTLSITAGFSGSEPKGYVWNRNGVDITRLGEVGTNLIISPVQLSDGGLYRCGVTNLVRTNVLFHSFVAMVVVDPPTDKTAHVGGTVVLTANANPVGNARFQWQFNGNNLAGRTSGTLVLTNVQLADAGIYTVLVTNSMNTAASAAYSCRLTVVEQPAAPAITQQPLSVVTNLGANVSFNVTATGTEVLYYQWWFNQTNRLTTGTNATLLLTNVALAQLGEYRVVVSNHSGVVTSEAAFLEAPLPPAIVTAPVSTQVLAGAQAVFAVSATGTSPLAYQWYRSFFTPIAGATNMTLVLPAAQSGDVGDYRVVVSNPYGAATSSVAWLTLLTPPGLVLQPQDQVLTPGQTARFFAVATGQAPLLFQWWRAPNLPLAGETNSVLVISNAQTAEAGAYFLTVSNVAGVFTSRLATLTISEGMVDTDQDGLPDDWERQNGLTVGINDANVDSDGDGHTNYQEFLAGTNPQDPNSVLALRATVVQGMPVLQFLAVSNRAYRLEFKNALGQPAWQLLTNLPPEPFNRPAVLSDPAPSSTNRFYRLYIP